MHLNLPIYERLEKCKKVLIAGMGGGYDIFCGLPIYFELKSRGIDTELANFSFSNIESLDDEEKISPTLAGITADKERRVVYFPEYYLARWFKSQHNEDITIWCFQKTGVIPLLENYLLLHKHLEFDGIVLIDGGFDALVRGDENETASLIEDAISLCAVNEMKVLKERILCCTAFGVELDLTFLQILENISSLIKDDGFYGSGSLLKNLSSYQKFESAVLYVQNQKFQDPSVINSSIISATRGEFGDIHLTQKTKGSHLSINPFMSQYWFFDLAKVAEKHLFLSQLRHSFTFLDALQRFLTVSNLIPNRETKNFNRLL